MGLAASGEATLARDQRGPVAIQMIIFVAFLVLLVLCTNFTSLVICLFGLGVALGCDYPTAHMIISGGVNIYPQEAENVLSAHAAVADVAVIGVPDAEMGEQVKAVVQTVPGMAEGPELGALPPIASCTPSRIFAACASPESDEYCPALLPPGSEPETEEEIESACWLTCAWFPAFSLLWLEELLAAR